MFAIIILIFENHKNKKGLIMKKIDVLILCFVLLSAMFVGCLDKSSTNATIEKTPTSSKVTLDVIDNNKSEASIFELKPYEPPVIDSDNTLAPIIQAALNTGKWPAEMEEVIDENELMVLYSLDKSKYANIMVVQCTLSTPFSEIIVIEVKDGKINEAQKALQQNVDDKLIDSMQFSSTIDTLQEAKISAVGNYVYYVACAEPAKAADAIEDALSSLAG